MTHNFACRVQHIHPLLWHLIDGLHEFKFAEGATGGTPAPESICAACSSLNTPRIWP